MTVMEEYGSSTLKSRQYAALRQMLGFNQAGPASSSSVISSATPTPAWKLLLFDRVGQDILSPLMNVKQLREEGVTLHLNIHTERSVKRKEFVCLVWINGFYLFIFLLKFPTKKYHGRKYRITSRDAFENVQWDWKSLIKKEMERNQVFFGLHPLKGSNVFQLMESSSLADVCSIRFR